MEKIIKPFLRHNGLTPISSWGTLADREACTLCSDFCNSTAPSTQTVLAVEISSKERNQRKVKIKFAIKIPFDF